MVPRALLAAGAVVVLAWLGVMLRDTLTMQTAGDALFRSPPPSGREFSRQLGRFQDAELLNPDPAPRMNRARFLLLRDRPRDALAAADGIVGDEPDNLDAWAVVYAAAQRVDPRRAAQARNQILRLNPLAARQLR